MAVGAVVGFDMFCSRAARVCSMSTIAAYIYGLRLAYSLVRLTGGGIFSILIVAIPAQLVVLAELREWLGEQP